MHPVFYYLAPYILIGIVGMALGNRKVSPKEQQQRWIKLITYLCIILGVIAGILTRGQFFTYFSVLLLVTVLAELLWVARQRLLPIFAYLPVFFTYAFLAIGFFCFAFYTPQSWILTGYFIVVTFDGFSQITGQLLGKRPFFNTISPGKTLEGFIGGACFGITASVLARNWADFTLWQALVTGGISVLLALTGDLTASYYKRLHGVKDFSKLLPGQGGMTDRFDSFLWVGASYGYFWLLF